MLGKAKGVSRYNGSQLIYWSYAKLGIRLLKPRGSESNLPKRILAIVRNLCR